MKTITSFAKMPLRIMVVVSMILLATSCVDHEVPSQVAAKIKTLPLAHSFTPTFYVQFEDLGNIPIAEYGIAMSTGISGQLVSVPTVADEIFKFTQSPTDLNVKTEIYPKLFADANYRAYAKLSDGSVVYGEVLKFRFQPL